MLDKFLATVSIATLVVFMGIVAVFVNEPDLWIVIVAVLIMAIFDFVTTLREEKKKPPKV